MLLNPKFNLESGAKVEISASLYMMHCLAGNTAKIHRDSMLFADTASASFVPLANMSHLDEIEEVLLLL